MTKNVYGSNEVEITHTLQVLCLDKTYCLFALMDDYKVQTGMVHSEFKHFCICGVGLSDYLKVQPVKIHNMNVRTRSM